MMGVKIEMPGKRLREDPAALRAALNSVGSRAAHTLASVLKRRYSLRGNHMQGWRGYASGLRRYISPKYPTRGGTTDRTGSFMFRNSSAFHASMGVKLGTFNVNKGSGMWSGLAVVVSGAGRARIAFRGRSEGQGMAWQGKAASGRPAGPYWRVNAKGKKIAKGKKVSNALKAWTVNVKSGVHLLAPSPEELNSLVVAVTAEATRALVAMHGPIQGLKIPQSAVARIMRQAADMTRTVKDLR